MLKYKTERFSSWFLVATNVLQQTIHGTYKQVGREGRGGVGGVGQKRWDTWGKITISLDRGDLNIGERDIWMIDGIVGDLGRREGNLVGPAEGLHYLKKEIIRVN